ncbi:MAG: hypothetical protein EOM44_13380 [Bacteroidia bacterium]|nr:hypothetical protein [Bacteroidia bacterium]
MKFIHLHKIEPNNAKSIFFITIFITIFLKIIIGAVWISRNFDKIPQYGDTVEYLHLASTLEVDQYRGILYPYFINTANFIACYLSVELHCIIYFFQIIIVFFSSWLLTLAFLPPFILTQTTQNSNCNILRQGIALITTMVVIFDPLIAHFSLTILTDSFSTSFTILFLSFLIFSLRKKNFYAFYVLIASVFFILMSLTRIDKLYLGFFVFSIYISILFFEKRKLKCKFFKTISFSIVTMLVSVVLVFFVKNQTQVFNHDRPPLDVISLAFNRVVWPRMSESYKYFPDYIKEKITLEDSLEFDKHNNNVYPFLTKILKENNGQKIIGTITFITFKHFPFQVLSKTLFDFLKYTLPNFTFYLEAINFLPLSIATDWTITRMAMFAPNLTFVFLVIGFISFIMLIIINTINVLNKKIFFSYFKATEKKADLGLLVISSAVVVNSMLFSFESGMDAHVRYALPSYVIILTAATSFFLKNFIRDK